MKLKVTVSKLLVFINVSAEHASIKIRDQYKEAEPRNRAVSGVGLRPLTCRDCRLESDLWYGCLFL
jgi:hypothetical protein